MPTRNVVLTKQQHALVDALVQSGRYLNASEVLREGLRLVELREKQESAKLQALREVAGKGWNDIEHGRYADVDDDQLEDFIGHLGRQAASRVQTAE